MHDYRKFKVSVNGRMGGGGQRLQRRRHGLAPAGRAQCGREQTCHPRRLAYPSDFSQWVALVNNIPTLASRLNGLSIANVAASSLNRRRCAVRRSPAATATPTNCPERYLCTGSDVRSDETLRANRAMVAMSLVCGLRQSELSSVTVLIN